MEIQNEIQTRINKTLTESNHFWYGCILGIESDKINSVLINDKNEEANIVDFLPVVKIKFGSIYNGIKGKIIKWYRSEYKLLTHKN